MNRESRYVSAKDSWSGRVTGGQGKGGDVRRRWIIVEVGVGTNVKWRQLKRKSVIERFRVQIYTVTGRIITSN